MNEIIPLLNSFLNRDSPENVIAGETPVERDAFSDVLGCRGEGTGTRSFSGPLAAESGGDERDRRADDTFRAAPWQLSVNAARCSRFFLSRGDDV